MGDPRKHRKKYTTPTHPWQKNRIVEESKLVKEYGLVNKREIWKASSKLAKMKDQVKRLATDTSKQGDLERELLMKKVRSLGLLDDSGSLSDILSLETKDILERRLQTLVFRQGWAKSIKQARQFIVHEHIEVDNRKITVPSHLVRESEKTKIGFAKTSKLYDAEHPERKVEQKAEKKSDGKTKDDDSGTKTESKSSEKAKDTGAKKENKEISPDKNKSNDSVNKAEDSKSDNKNKPEDANGKEKTSESKK